MKENRGNLFGSPGLRLIQLYIFLCRKGGACSLTQLSQTFSCSRQSILRMADQLPRIPGAQFESWIDKKERFFRLTPEQGGPQLVFTAETLAHLSFCRDIVSHLLSEKMRRELGEGLSAMQAAGTSPGEGVPDSFAAPLLKGMIDYTPHQGVLDALQDAMREQRLCRIIYFSRKSGENRRYLAAALRLLAYREALYLHCRCYDSPKQPTDTFRTLAIHRIKDLRLTPTIHETPPSSSHDPAPHFGFTFHPPIRIRIALIGGAATYAEERIWSADQKVTRKKDGRLHLSFTSTSRNEVISWVLGFGPEAELLEPEDLRQEIHQQAHKICQHYAPKKTTQRQQGNEMMKKGARPLPSRIEIEKGSLT